jgi:hypothetical protein
VRYQYVTLSIELLSTVSGHLSYLRDKAGYASFAWHYKSTVYD